MNSDNTTFAIDTQEKAWAWGLNPHGFLGTGDTQDRSSPTLIQFPEGTKISSIVNSGNTTFAIDTEGQVWAWGENEYGQLGTGDTQDKSSPTLIQLPKGTKISSIVAVYGSTFAIDTEGKLWAWGMNPNGSFGIGSRNRNINSPTQVQFPEGTQISSVVSCAGGRATFASDTKGKVWAWGNIVWSLWRRTAWGITNNDFILQLPEGKQIPSLVTGGGSVFVIDTEGQVWAWGSDTDALLIDDGGYGDRRIRGVPTNANLITLPEGKKISSIVLLESFLYNTSLSVFAIDTEGQVWAWGQNNNGQLGTGDTQDKSSPTLIQFPEGTQISSIVNSGNTTFAIDTEGQVWAWGQNPYDQLLGTGDNQNRYSPTLITSLPRHSLFSLLCNTKNNKFYSKFKKIVEQFKENKIYSAKLLKLLQNVNYLHWVSGENESNLERLKNAIQATPTLVLNEKLTAQIIFIQHHNTLISLLITQLHEGDRIASIIADSPEHTEFAHNVLNEVQGHLPELNLQGQVLNHSVQTEQGYNVSIELLLHASLGILNAFQNGELTNPNQVTQEWLNEYLHLNMNQSKKSTQTHVNQSKKSTQTHMNQSEQSTQTHSASLIEESLGALSTSPEESLLQSRSIIPVVLGIMLSYMYMLSN